MHGQIRHGFGIATLFAAAVLAASAGSVAACGTSTEAPTMSTSPATASMPAVTTTIDGSAETHSTTTADTQPGAVPTTAATEPELQPTSTAVATDSTVAPAAVSETFVRLTAGLKPLTIFAPTRVPTGAKLASYWLPVIDSASPAQSAVRHENPYILGQGDDAEVQVVLQLEGGWLVIIENFHGDLGDVTGVDVGMVDGNPASLYAVNGGELVQWSKDGKWYGVFGRGVGKGAILALALGMVQASAESL